MLLHASFACALGVFATAAQAQLPTTVTGGGATSPAADYVHELTNFNASEPAAQFGNVDPRGGTIIYWASGATGQLAFLNDDNTCNSSRVITGTTTCANSPGGANEVAYGASESALTSTQIAAWATSPVGKTISGGLVQVPSMGAGVAIPVVNSKVTKNGQVALTDHDLCNIFTGGITDWSQTSAASKLAAGTITVVYRSDSAGISVSLLNHLTAVCTGANAPPAGVTLATTTYYATIFPTTQGGIFQTPVVVSGVTYYLPANFQPESGSSGVSGYLSNLAGVTVTSAIGYLTPDLTTIDPNSDAVLSNGQKSKLVVASVVNASNGVAYTPSVGNITLGLNNALSGTNLTPPKTPTDLADPSKWVPIIQTTNSGYPIVNYTTFDFAQCYATPSIATAIKAFLNDHYKVTSYKTIQANNGLVALKLTKAAGFLTAISNNLLGNKGGQKLDIGDKSACKNLGR